MITISVRVSDGKRYRDFNFSPGFSSEMVMPKKVFMTFLHINGMRAYKYLKEIKKDKVV